MMLSKIVAIMAALALVAAPAANAVPSETVLCAFYAEDEPYIATGVGYAANRAAAEAAECPVRSDPHGADPDEPEDQQPPVR